MLATLWTLARDRYPFKGRLLWFGAGSGVVMGLWILILGESTDQATATGLAAFMSCTVGGWLGLVLGRWSLRWLMQRQTTMDVTLNELIANVAQYQRSQFAIPAERKSQHEHPNTHRSWRRRLYYRCLLDLPLVSLFMLPILLLQVLMDLRVGLYDGFDSMQLIASLLGVLALSVSGLIFQHVTLSFRSRRIAKLQREAHDILELMALIAARPDTMVSPVQAGEALDLADFIQVEEQQREWERAIHPESSWIQQFTGMTLEQATLERHPEPAA